MSSKGTYVEVSATNINQNESWDLVSGKFDSTKAYADNSYKMTYQYVGYMQDLISALTPPKVTAITDVVCPEITPLNYILRPRVSSLDLDVNIPALTAQRPVFADVPDVPEFNMPVMRITEPVWARLEKPTLNQVSSPGAPPSIEEIVIPVQTSITLPPVPSLAQIVIPTAPEIVLPAFDAIRPSIEVTLPEPFSYREPIYQSDMWTEIMIKILNDIRNGGTGLAIDVEDGIWTRANERLRYEKEQSTLTVVKRLGASGFNMPYGAITSALLELEDKWVKGLQEQGFMISEAQAKLAQTNSHFIVEKGIACEGILRAFFNDQNNRILSASKEIAVVGIEVFKASVDLHNAKVEQYKADAQVFEARVRAAQQVIELFKSKVEASKVSAEVQSLLVDIYQKQITAAEVQAKIYTYAIEGAKLRADVNKTRIESYKVLVEAYAVSIGGEKLKLDLYNAEIEGEKGKSEIYRSQVNAFMSTVEAESKATDAHIHISSAKIQQNTSLINQYKTELEAYNTEIQALVSTLGAKVSGFEAEVSAYNAETQAEGSYYNVLAKEMDVRIANANFKLQKAVEEIKSVTAGYVAIKELEVKGAEGVMNVSAQLAASALSATHAGATYSYNVGESWGHSDSITESHSFDETPT